MERVAEDDRPRTTKLIYFYKSGDSKFQGLRIPVNARRYRTLDALLDDLSYRIPGLSYGARRLATPRGRHMVTKVADLDHLASYICTDKLNTKKIPGIKIDEISSGTNFSFRGAFMNPPKVTEPPISPKKKKNRSPSTKKKIKRTASQPEAAPKSEEARKARPRKRIPKVAERPTQSEPKKKAQSPHKAAKTDGKTKTTKTTLSGLRTLRSAHSAPDGSVDRGEPVAELSPLDSNKLRHVQRRRIATKKVPSATTDSGDSLPPKAPKKKKKSKSPKKAVSELERQQTNVTLVDKRRKQAWSEDDNQAATKIQSQYRGYRARQEYKSLKEQEEASRTPRKEPNEADKEEAAIKIQSHYRGYQTRKEVENLKMQADNRTLASILDNDLDNDTLASADSLRSTVDSGSVSRNGTAQTRPKSIMVEDEAALRIQAAYRGYSTRKQLNQDGKVGQSRVGTPHPRKSISRSGSRLTDSGVSMIEHEPQEIQV